ncbi:MAG: hypothetical protein KH354_00130 [Clostridiales bacterium]|nr:hypothetical protein [Clostridiales bacterium]
MKSKEALVYYARRCAGVLIAAALAVGIITAAVYHRTETVIPESHAILFFYRSNVPGTHADQWEKSFLAHAYPGTQYIEVQCFQPGISGQVSAQDSGWFIITARLAKHEGDILFLDRERYEYLQENGYLAPMDALPAVSSLPENRRLKASGQCFGLLMQGMLLEGLEFPAAQDRTNNVLGPAEGGDELIACLYRTHTVQAEAILNGILESAQEIEPVSEKPAGGSQS